MEDNFFKELKEKHKEKGTANKDDKDLLELANKLLGGNSQMLLKYNDLPFFDVLKDEDKATYRVYTDGTDKFEKIKDAVQKEDEIDTNDNGKIEVDEMADFQKSLDDYLAKNPDAKKKNYY